MRFTVCVALVMLTLPLAPHFEQSLQPTDGTSPGIEAEQWSQSQAQESFPPDPAQLMALAVCTQHVFSLRKIAR